MYNHARTLLMNIKGGTRVFGNYPGDELIPDTYRQLELPTYLDVFRMRFFGAMPDRTMLNYRVAQLMTLIESTELQSHVLALDSRLTYPSSATKLFDPATFSPVVQLMTPKLDPSAVLTLLGSAISPDASGICQYQYDITKGVTNFVDIVRKTVPPVTASKQYTFTDGLSSVIELPLSGYKFRHNTTTTGVTWRVSGFLRPANNLLTIEQGLRSIGEPYLLQLFGVSDEEPYLTFRNCWNKHPEFAYRLGGLVLAMIYRTEEIRNG